MYRNYYYAEVFIFLFLHHVGWNLPSTTVLSCSRNKSRLVRMIIHKKVMPLLLRYKLSLPQTCPFHIERDALWWPSVQNFQDGYWLCPFCGQMLSSEEDITKHWDAKHAQEFNQNEDSVCLADFCDIFRCEVISAAIELEKQKFLSSSFPSIQYHQNKTPCDDKKMFHMQKKCKAVMRQCLLGLLATVSVKDFQDIEDEINQAICSYLTCSRYLDGSLQVVHPVPLLFCIIIGSVLMGGFGLCYYVVWTLSDPLYSFHNEAFFNSTAQSNSQGGQFRKNNEYHYQRDRNKYVYSTR